MIWAVDGFGLALFSNLASCKSGLELYVTRARPALPPSQVRTPSIIRARTRAVTARTREAYLGARWCNAEGLVTHRAGYPMAALPVCTSESEGRGSPLYAQPNHSQSTQSTQSTVHPYSKIARCSRSPQICRLSDSSLTPTPRSYSERSLFRCISIQ
jgi:hypothetical protein